MQEFRHKVLPGEMNIRLDKLLVTLNEGYSRSQVQNWFEEGLIHVNDRRAKANHRTQSGELIRWMIPETENTTPEKESIPLTVLYEDQDLLIIEKPRGMVTHPAPGHPGGTLVNALLNHTEILSDVAGEQRPGIVHRLDKDTGGLLVAAKNNQVHLDLQEQLAEQKMVRQYEALVHGTLDHAHGLIEAPIGRDPDDRKKMGVVAGGKEAVTEFFVQKSYQKFSHIICHLKTGRTHQIRVHMKYIGHPIAGDATYGPRKTLETDGQVLHARTLGFYHPSSGEWMEFHSDLPAYFQRLLEKVSKMY